MTAFLEYCEKITGNREKGFKQLDKIEEHLKKIGSYYNRQPVHDGEIINVYDEKIDPNWTGEDCFDHYLWDVIYHSGCYGYEKGLVEVMGEYLLGHDDVEGYLTAEEVIEKIENAPAYPTY